MPPVTIQASPEQLEKIGGIAANLVQSGQRVGLGSGRAALAFVHQLARRVREEKLDIVGLATSILTEKTARELGIPTTTLDKVEALDIAVDGADEVDPELRLIKGGGGNQTREKVVEVLARRLIIVVGQEKVVDRLGTNFPIFVEVVAFAMASVQRVAEKYGARVELRLNPDGSTFITDNGNPILNCHFSPHLNDPAEFDALLHRTPGVIETGLFLNMASEAIVAYADGQVKFMRATR